MTYEQNNYLFTIGLFHDSTSPHPSCTFYLDFFHPALIQPTDHDMHLSHWHYSRRWCWGRGLLPIHSRGKGKCLKQTKRFKVNARILQRLTKNISPKTCQFSFPQKYFVPILSKMISSFPIYSPQYQTFIFYTLKTLPRMAQKYILSLNHIIWDPTYQLESISVKSLRLWLLLQ